MPTPSKDVHVGKPDPNVTAHIMRGPVITAIPALIDDITTSGLVPAGFVNEDGVEITPNETTETIKDWALDIVRRILTEFDSTVSWTHIDLTLASLRNYFGTANVDSEAATATKGTQARAALAPNELEEQTWLFQIKDGLRRIAVLIPRGAVSERGAIPLVASGPVTLPVTVQTFPDAAGKHIYIYTDDGVVSA